MIDYCNHSSKTVSVGYVCFLKVEEKHVYLHSIHLEWH